MYLDVTWFSKICMIDGASLVDGIGDNDVDLPLKIHLQDQLNTCQTQKVRYCAICYYINLLFQMN